MKRNLGGHEGAITALISYENSIYSASRDGTLRCWNQDCSEIVPWFVGGLAPALVGLALGPDGDLLVASEKGIYSLQRRLLIAAGQLVGLCSHYALTANGRLISTQTRNQEIDLKQPAEGGCWSPDGGRLFTWTHTGVCRLYTC